MKPPRGLIKIYKGELGLAAREYIKNNLTVVPQSKSSFGPDPDPIRLWFDDGDYIYVPRGYYNTVIKKRFDPKIEFQFSPGVAELRPNAPITLREGQEETISAAIDVMKSGEFGGAIIEAPTGSGKTVLGMETARRLGMKTLFVVHTSVLMEQWMKEMRKFMPNWSLGIIQAGTCDTANNDVCVAMLQSLALGEDYPEWVYDEFGFVVFDEIHVSAAAEFQKALFKFKSKYIMGLSGTLKRKDKAENVFKHGVGEVIPAMNKIEILKPVIYFIDTKYVWSDKGKSGKPIYIQKNKFLESIIFDQARNEILLQNTVKAATAGRHVLVLSERVGHVEVLYRELLKRLLGSGIKVGMMVGSSSKEQRDFSENAQVLVATVQLLAVGFNNPRLDTLVMGTPIQSMEQAVGRILRKHPEKKTPLVLDLVDSGSTMGKTFGQSRMWKYRAKGWQTKGEECLK